MTMARDAIHPSTFIGDSPVEVMSFVVGIVESRSELAVYKADMGRFPLGCHGGSSPR
jgi:hypothetical protein